MKINLNRINGINSIIRKNVPQWGIGIMWTGSSMNFIQSLEVFGLGFSIVFIILILLALAIMIFSKIFSTKESGRAAANIRQNSSAGQAPEKDQDDLLAVLVAVVSEEINLPVDLFRITKIREI